MTLLAEQADREAAHREKRMRTAGLDISVGVDKNYDEEEDRREADREKVGEMFGENEVDLMEDSE